MIPTSFRATKHQISKCTFLTNDLLLPTLCFHIKFSTCQGRNILHLEFEMVEFLASVHGNIPKTHENAGKIRKCP